MVLLLICLIFVVALGRTIPCHFCYLYWPLKCLLAEFGMIREFNGEEIKLALFANDMTCFLRDIASYRSCLLATVLFFFINSQPFELMMIKRRSLPLADITWIQLSNFIKYENQSKSSELHLIITQHQGGEPPST